MPTRRRKSPPPERTPRAPQNTASPRNLHPQSSPRRALSLQNHSLDRCGYPKDTIPRRQTRRSRRSQSAPRVHHSPNSHSTPHPARYSCAVRAHRRESDCPIPEHALERIGAPRTVLARAPQVLELRASALSLHPYLTTPSSSACARARARSTRGAIDDARWRVRCVRGRGDASASARARRILRAPRATRLDFSANQ